MTSTFDNDLFFKIFNSYSPSSREYDFQKEMAQMFTSLGYDSCVDACGNFFTKLQSNDKPTLLLVAHADHVALQVKEITPEGFLKFRKIGGIDIHSFYGQEVIILHNKRQIPGIIGRNPRNVNESESGFTINTNSMWVDIGATSAEEAKQYVSVNDFIVFKHGSTRLMNDCIATPSADDKVGIYCLYKVAEKLSKIQTKLPFNVCYALSSQEEIGCRGSKALAMRFRPEIAIIVDTEYASDFPSGKGDIVLGSGPVLTDNADNNPSLVKIARELNMKHQYAYINEFFGCTDAESFITNSPDTAVLGIGVPVRNMHSAKEVLCTIDLNDTIELILAFIEKIAEKHHYS